MKRMMLAVFLVFGVVVTAQEGAATLPKNRWWLQPGQPLAIQGSSEPSLLIALVTAGGFKAGQEQWVPASTPIKLTNTATVPIDFLRFEFKTRPLGTSRFEKR